MRRWYASATASATATAAQLVRSPSSSSSSRRFYATARTRTAGTDLSEQIYSLRKQERLALYQLRENADDFIRHIERILVPARALPSPESLLNAAAAAAASSSSSSSSSSSVSRQYISTERYSAAARHVEQGDALIKHAREIQEHCKELEAEPHDERQLTRRDAFVQDSHTHPPDFVVLRLEEKARTKDIEARLADLKRRTDIARQVVQIAAHDGLAAASAFLKRVEATTVLDAASAPLGAKSALRRQKPALSSSSREPLSWDAVQEHLEEQLDSEEAASKTSRTKR